VGEVLPGEGNGLLLGQNVAVFEGDEGAGYLKAEGEGLTAGRERE